LDHQEKTSSNSKGLKVFYCLMGIYGRAFSTLYETPISLKTAKAQWSDALENVNSFLIRKALKELRNGTYDEYIHFAPTIPAFLKLCKPDIKDLNLPDLNASIDLAIIYLANRNDKYFNGIEHQKFIERIIKKTGSGFRSLPSKECRRIFKPAYDEAVIEECELHANINAEQNP
jgi:hypothetical protein